MSNARAKLRVLRSYLRLPPEVGGMERHIALLSSAQRALGVEVINIYNTGKAGAASIQVLSSFKLHRISPAALRNAFFYLWAAMIVKRQANNAQNVLHIHGDWSDFLFSKLLAKRLGANVVAASVHCTVREAVPWLYRIALSHCDPIFVTGKVEHDYLEKTLNRGIHHLPSAPLDVFFDTLVSDMPTKYDVITVSNMLPVKKTELIIDCAIKRPNLRFLVIGDGPRRAEIEKRIENEGVNNVKLQGNSTPDEIAIALRTARMFLLTSEKEGTPTAALEAMAAGLPVVLTPSNDYSWLIQDGVNGFITFGWDVDGVVAKVDACLTNEKVRRIMGENNRRLAQKHRWSVKAQLVTDLMRDELCRRMA